MTSPHFRLPIGLAALVTFGASAASQAIALAIGMFAGIYFAGGWAYLPFIVPAFLAVGAAMGVVTAGLTIVFRLLVRSLPRLRQQLVGGVVHCVVVATLIGGQTLHLAGGTISLPSLLIAAAVGLGVGYLSTVTALAKGPAVKSVA